LRDAASYILVEWLRSGRHEEGGIVRVEAYHQQAARGIAWLHEAVEQNLMRRIHVCDHQPTRGAVGPDFTVARAPRETATGRENLLVHVVELRSELRRAGVGVELHAGGQAVFTFGTAGERKYQDKCSFPHRARGERVLQVTL
jgi:hypothetical protein